MSLPPPIPPIPGPRLCTPPDSAHTVSRVDDEAQLRLSCQKSRRSGCQDATAAPADITVAQLAQRRGLTADGARAVRAGNAAAASRMGAAWVGQEGCAGPGGDEL